jgi:tetratricopeptide (TPR) repeat protein
VKSVLQKSLTEAEIEAKQASQVLWKKLKIIILGLSAVFVMALVGYYLVWPKVRLWRQQRSLAEAENYEKAGDYRRALLILEQTVQINPQNWEARRRLANFLERSGHRQGLEAWKEIVQAEPADPRNLLGLAGAALRSGDITAARQALAQLQRTGRTDAAYYRLSSGLALVTHDVGALEAALAELSRLEPMDQRVRLNLATVRLQSADPGVVEAGRTALIALARSGPVRIRAIVELLNDMARRWPQPARERAAAFQQLAAELTPARGPTYDRPEVGDPVERLVSYAMRQPAPEAEDAGALLSWLILNGRAAAGFEWLDRLPENIRHSRLVTATASEAALKTGDWPHLRQLLLAGAWGALPPLAVNGAFDARRNRSQLSPAALASRWASVIESCKASLPALRMLLRLSEAWKWPDEQQQVLEAITRDFAGESWAWRRLISQALVRSETEKLWQVYQRWSRAAPGDTTVQIEAAIMGHLLQKSGAPSPSVTSSWVQRQPVAPGAVVAHALALWRAQRMVEALTLLGALPAEAFAEPRYALAYGLMLSEAGRARESEPLLNRASAERMLPDEMLLIEQARARNQPRLSVSRQP